jgi:hypothetical protein
MKTLNLSNVIYVIIQLPIIKSSENTLKVFMKISSNINASFANRDLVRKVHSTGTLKWFMRTKSSINVLFAKRALD